MLVILMYCMFSDLCMSLITVPSGAPTNITVESLSSTSLMITWEPPAPSQRNGVITQYRLLVTSDSGETEVYDVSGSLLSREIEGNVLTWCRKLSIVNLTSFFFSNRSGKVQPVQNTDCCCFITWNWSTFPCCVCANK